MHKDGTPERAQAPSPDCVSCGKPLEQAGADRCNACQSPQRGIALWFYKHGAVLDLIKATLLAILVPLIIFLATQTYTRQVEQNKKEKEKYDQVLGSLADAKIALASLYQPCFDAWQKCRSATDTRLSTYRGHVARFALAVNRYEPDFDPSIQLLQSMDGAVAEDLRQIWGEFSRCMITRNDALVCDEMRRRRPVIHLQAAQFVMAYLACAVESRYATERGEQMSTRCWAIMTERQTICYDQPAELVQAYADAIEKGDAKGSVRLPFHEVTNAIIDDFLLPGSELE